LKEAVRCRMRAVGGVAAELSGGLDSSSVVGIIAALRKEGQLCDLPFETFSMAFSDPAADERVYIREVLEMHDFRHSFVESGMSSFESCREQARLYKCAPHYPGFEMLEPLRRRASAKGLRVAVTGEGGDEWVTGSTLQFVDLIRSFRLAETFRRLRTDVRLIQLHPTMSDNALTVLLRYRIWPAVPERIRRIVRKSVGRDILPPWLNRDLVLRTHLKERLQRRPDQRRYSSPVRQETYDSFRHGWLTYFLETIDRAWARHGVEVRHPFHDLRLIEFLISIPEDQRRRGDETKFVLRRGMRGLVPKAVLSRREKADFSRISVQAFQNVGGERLFDSLAVASAGWVEPKRARAAYQEMIHLYVRGDINYAARVWPLFSLFAIDLWFKEAILNWQDENVTFGLTRASVSA
jgi:asparagine synthase (glutamine-hydrolysing)